MEFLSVIVAAAASFFLGAIWYMGLSGPWVRAAGVRLNEDGKPEGGQSPALFGATFALQLVVAGMMRHLFSLSGIETLGAAAIAGAGIGAFFITPWIAINHLYESRPLALTAINGGYAIVACMVMGVVLTVL